jgi:small ligand-binding sensory domain FIST
MIHSAHSQNNDWQVALEDCLRELPVNVDATLGIIYVTDVVAPHFSSILDILKKNTGISQWVGSAGYGICARSGSGCSEYFDVPAIAIMTVALPEKDFEILSTKQSIEAEASQNNLVSDNILHGPPLVLLHGDCANEEVLEIIQDIAIETEGYLVGALTLSDTLKHQVAGKVTGGGVSGVILNSEVTVTTALSQGCQPIGKLHEVTECVEYIIIGLNGRSAAEVFKEDIGEVLARDLEKVGGFIHVALPVIGSDTGDYVVRNLLGVDEEEGVLAIAAPVEHGDQLMFVSRDANTAQKDLVEMVARLKKRSGSNIKGGIYISCIARGPHMFGEVNTEIQIIESVLGNIPIIGLYANGEISNNRLYSYTGVLTLFT